MDFFFLAFLDFLAFLASFAFLAFFCFLSFLACFFSSLVSLLFVVALLSASGSSVFSSELGLITGDISAVVSAGFSASAFLGAGLGVFGADFTGGFFATGLSVVFGAALLLAGALAGMPALSGVAKMISVVLAAEALVLGLDGAVLVLSAGVTAIGFPFIYKWDRNIHEPSKYYNDFIHMNVKF
ncbi:MAG TPA: hypothetical protein VFF74_05825 [Methylophilaceae bacterium]|nr:hypothetical protein [Methylophilaceae bacterium]